MWSLQRLSPWAQRDARGVRLGPRSPLSKDTVNGGRFVTSRAWDADCLIPATHLFFCPPPKFGVASLPKDSGLSDNFLPELLASAGDFFMGDLSHPSLFFFPLHCASLIAWLCSSALHFHLLSLRLPTMAPTLHTATAFWLLLPCDLLPFVSILLSLIHALPEGQAYLSDMHFISCS